MLYRVVGVRAEAEDLLQETFVRLHNNWTDIHPNKRKSWLFQVASNLSLNRVRDNKLRSRRYQDAVEQAHVSEFTQSNPAQSMTVRATMNELPERQAKLLTLYAAGLNHAELAEAMDVKRSSLSQLLFRAKRAFEELYSSTEGGQ